MPTYTYTGLACSGTFKTFVSAAVPFAPIRVEYRTATSACGSTGYQAWAIGAGGQEHRIVVNSGTIWQINSLTPNWTDTYDCINGTCTPRATYGTQGVFASLAACEAGGCGAGTACQLPFKCLDPDNYCPPGKVCIPQSEWSQIEGLSGQLRSKNCS